MVRGKEDMNRFRQKLRENGPKWEEHKKKERERIKKYRQKVKNDPENQAKKVTTVEQKKKKAERMRQYRATLKYKIEHPEANRLPYKTKQSLFKAVNRVRKVLPECIDRKRIVLKQLCEEFYPEISSEISKKENEIKNDYKKVCSRKIK